MQKLKVNKHSDGGRLMLDLIGKLVDPVSNILDKVIEDKIKARLAHEIATMAEKLSTLMMQQLKILQADAQGNWFQAS